MKKQYIIPALSIDHAELEQMLAASRLTATEETTSVTLSDEEYEGEFSTKSGGEFLWDE